LIVGTPEYLAREPDSGGLASGAFWFSDYGLQLSRQFRALKVWMSIKGTASNASAHDVTEYGTGHDSAA
jgi:hypothetical protein